MRHLIVTQRPEALRDFSQALAEGPGDSVAFADSAATALELVKRDSPDIVIVDATLPDTHPFQCITQLLMVNAMVNTAVITPMPEAEFHERFEGLGVLCPLPDAPTARDAQEPRQRLQTLAT